MPGALIHLSAAIAMFIIGRYYFKSYFEGNNKHIKLIILLFSCLFFSFVMDFVLIIYYTTHILPFNTMWPLHTLVHIFFLPAAIISILSLKFLADIKSKPIWIMGMWCILLHLTMDFIIPDTNIWI